MTTEAKRLVNDLKVVGRDTEDLIKATAGDLTEKARDVRSRALIAVESAKDRCLDLQEKAMNGARKSDKLIRENPYKTMGIALGIGLLAGFLIKRGSRN